MDALMLPFQDETFDVVFCSFTLELFDTPEIPIVLSEIKRVLRINGRFGIVSMSKENGSTMILKLYEWLHEILPGYADCRPIYVEQALTHAGFIIRHKEIGNLMGLPIEMIIAGK